MALDWDSEVFGPVHGVFGENITYTPASGLPFVLMDAIFEEQYRRVTINDDGAPITTEQPAVSVRLGTFPCGSKPRLSDKVTVASMSATYVVRDVQLDNHGLAKLMLQLVGPTP